MKSREDVIKGLEHCIEKLDTVVNKNHGFNCIECPYIEECEHVGSLIGIPLMRDAFALLKAQEPRVMTLDEVAGCVALERETPIYMEFGYMATNAGQVIELNPKHMYFDDENGLSWCVREGPDHGKQDGVRLDEYNDIWRCWTSRPDDATREATPWD